MRKVEKQSRVWREGMRLTQTLPKYYNIHHIMSFLNGWIYTYLLVRVIPDLELELTVLLAHFQWGFY